MFRRWSGMGHFDMRVLVIIPTYDERENVAAIVGDVRSLGYDVLVVDDGSPDGTGEIADELAAADPHVSVIHRPRKEGLGPAYAHGFAVGLERGAEILCEMDADFSHDPADLVRLVESVAAGADLAIGSRYVSGGATEGWPWHRRLLSWGGNRYARFALGLSVNDATAGFRAFRDTTIRKIDPATCEASGYGFQVEMAWRTECAGLKIVEVPITFRERVRGNSKMDFGIAREAMWLVTKWGANRIVKS